jgi:hypothetical protein
VIEGSPAHKRERSTDATDLTDLNDLNDLNEGDDE